MDKEKFFAQFGPIKTADQRLAYDNCIAIFLVGSHLYGTNTAESDMDYEGLFIEPPDYVIGNKSCLEVDFSTKSPSKMTARNTPKDIDCKLYSIKNFFYLALKNNPNKLEWFFIPDRNVIYADDIYWPQVKAAKDLFLSLRLKHSFTGYANSQKRKLLTKKQRLEEMRELLYVLDKKIAENGEGLTLGDVFRDDYVSPNWPYKFITRTTTLENTPAIMVNDKEFNWGMGIDKIRDNVKNHVEQYGHRTLSLDERGFDDKFASHLFRLYYEGLKLLKEGRIDFPLEENKFLLAVKKGEFTLEEILAKADMFEPLFEQAYLQSTLPHGPAQDKVSDLQVHLYLSYWREKGWV